jgi:hypothetical protein
MNREDLNWRKLNLQTEVKTINQMPDCQSAKAFVLDDSIKIRGVVLLANGTFKRSNLLNHKWPKV